MVRELRPHQIGGIHYHTAYPVRFDNDDLKVATAPNTTITLTLSADTDKGLYLPQLMYGYTGTGTPDGTIRIADGGVIVWGPFAVTEKMNIVNFDPPRMGDKEHSLVITLFPGGAGLTGIIWANCLKQA